MGWGVNGGMGYEWGVYMLCGVIDEIWGVKMGYFDSWESVMCRMGF